MNKIPCLFLRDFDGTHKATIREEVTPGCEWVLAGEGKAYVKRDGTACLVRAGRLYKRYDAKRGKAPPPGFVACGEPDPVTGHHPGWLLVGDEPESRWHRDAVTTGLADGTYELVGPKVGGNERDEPIHRLIKHDSEVIVEPATQIRDFSSIKNVLSAIAIEGIVYHHPDGRMAKIRRKDFGFRWP